MRESRRFSLVEVDRERHTARLAADGAATATVLTGLDLEAQFELADGTSLVWLTEDSPHDEGLHVYLLRRDGSIEDAIEAGVIFAAGVLKLKGTGAEWVEFEFFLGRGAYRLDVAPAAGFRWAPSGWRYKKRLGRHRLIVRPATRGGAS